MSPLVDTVIAYMLPALTCPAEQIWLSYKDRADAENRIKELKYDFGLDSFCMDKFWATEAAFRTIMIAYQQFSHSYLSRLFGVFAEGRLPNDELGLKHDFLRNKFLFPV